MNGLSEGYERAVDQNWGCMAKIHAQENGSRGTHFAKFLISYFLKGLTYSALYGVNNSSVCSMNAMFGSLQFKTQSTVLKSTSYILKYFDPGVSQGKKTTCGLGYASGHVLCN